LMLRFEVRRSSVVPCGTTAFEVRLQFGRSFLWIVGLRD